MEVAGVILAIVVGAASAYFAYLQWRDRRPKARLEYVVTTKSELMPEGWAESLQVVHDGEPVANPTLVIARIVHTGDGAIETGDFETSLTLRLEGAESIASVNRTGQRPADFAPELVIDGNTVRIEPTLINPEDMLELQILSAGKPEKVELGGRVSGLTFKRLPRLPYPPGGGPEGELLGFDKFMWWIFTPGIAVAGALAIGLDESSSTAVRIIVSAGALIGGLVLYPLRVRFLIRRRAMWRP